MRSCSAGHQRRGKLPWILIKNTFLLPACTLSSGGNFKDYLRARDLYFIDMNKAITLGSDSTISSPSYLLCSSEGPMLTQFYSHLHALQENPKEKNRIKQKKRPHGEEHDLFSWGLLSL